MKQFSRKFFLPFSLLLLAETASAQDPMTFAHRPAWPVLPNDFQRSIAFSGEYAAGSDALTNSFISSFYRGEYLDSALKKSHEDRLLPTNRIGAYAAYGMAYSWRDDVDSTKWEYMIAYRDRQVLFGTFAPDAFTLAFEGNRAFRGRTAILDETRLVSMHWQQLQFEAKYFSPDNNSEAAFGFSLLNGQSMQEISIRRGSVFTQSDGTFIDVTSDATYYSSDTGSTRFGARNGRGVSFNFRLSTSSRNTEGPFIHHFSFAVQDLGYIRWNDRTQVYDVDTTIHFTGADASDVILNGGTVAGLPESDSLIGEPEHNEVIMFLPLGLRFRYGLVSRHQWWGLIDVRSWSHAGALPHVSLLGGWHTKKNTVRLLGGVAWGGYAQVQVPLQVSWEACRQFTLMAGTTNLAGYIVPDKTHGQGLYFNLSFAF